MKHYTSGQLARAAGMNVETLRFYERKGLLPEPPRSSGGFRLYGEEDVKRLRFIGMAKQHGFTLREIKELLDLRVDSQTGCEDVRHIAEEKLAVIDRKLRELRQMKKALEHLVDSCHHRGASGNCPILEAFERDRD